MSKKEQLRHPIVMVSLDAVSDSNIDYLLSCPNFSRLASMGILHRDVDSILVTSTYPVHASISTGLVPGEHGIFDNTVQDPVTGKEVWRIYKKQIKGKTLPERAYEHGLRTCAMMFPMTSGEKIRYHLVEIPGKTPMVFRALQSAHYGSARFMLHYFAKYGKYVISQGGRGMDTLIAKTGADLIRKNKADLYMLHLLDVDTKKHNHGATSPEATEALRRIDECLGDILAAMESVGMLNFEVLIFSDHSCLDMKHALDPNQLLQEYGLTPREAYFHTTHGCAFLYIAETASEQARTAATAFADSFVNVEGVKRELTEQEMQDCGAKNEGFVRGYSAVAGYDFGNFRKGQHGYPLDNEDYKIFYLEIGPRLTSGSAAAISQQTATPPARITGICCA